MEPMKYLREEVVSVSPDTSAIDVAKIMDKGERRRRCRRQTDGYLLKKGVRRMPIVKRNGRLTGIVTPDDIIRMPGEEISYIARNLEKQSPPLPR